MTVKVFISHQAADSFLAKKIATRLKAIHSIDTYLDVIDPGIQSGEDLAAHIRSEMGKCTQLLAVVSESTRGSWWVPWEIGMATEKDFPLATYSDGPTLPPEYLIKWPYLRSDRDLDRYASASISTNRSFVQKSATFSESVARHSSTRDFFTNLRRDLGQ